MNTPKFFTEKLRTSNISLILISISIPACTPGDSDSSTCLGFLVFVIFILWLVDFGNRGGKEKQPPSVYVNPNKVDVSMASYTTTKLINDEIIKDAQVAVEYTAKHYKRSLDYSLASLNLLSEIFAYLFKGIQSKRASKKDVDLWVRYYGAYLGEVIHRAWGGDWMREVDQLHGGASVFLSVKGTKQDPYQIIRDVIQSGRVSELQVYLEQCKMHLDFIQPNEKELEFDELESDELEVDNYFGLPFALLWDGNRSYVSSIEGVVEFLQETHFPFWHHSTVSLNEIVFVEPEHRTIMETAGGETNPFNLPPYVFTKKFTSSTSQYPKTLILGAYSKRDLINMLRASGFRIEKNVSTVEKVEVKGKMEEQDVSIIWLCPNCQGKNITTLKPADDLIVSCASCKSTYGCVQGQVVFAQCRIIQYRSTLEYAWAVRLMGINRLIEEFTFKTVVEEMIISEGDYIIALYSNGKDGGNKVVLVENRTTLKNLIL